VSGSAVGAAAGVLSPFQLDSHHPCRQRSHARDAATRFLRALVSADDAA